MLHFGYIEGSELESHTLQMLCILHAIDEISANYDKYINIYIASHGCSQSRWAQSLLASLTYTQFLVYMDRDSWVRAQIQLIPSSIKSFDHILSHVCECHHFHLMDAIILDIVFDILSCT